MKHLTLTVGLSAIVLAWTIAVPAHAYEAGPVTGGGTIEGKAALIATNIDELNQFLSHDLLNPIRFGITSMAAK